MVKITVGIMNPEDERSAKKLYVEKINQLSQVLAFEIPAEIHSAIKSEQSLVLSTKLHRFDFEVYGVGKKWMSLIIE